MKKYIRIILSIVVILMFVGCGKKEKHEIEILIPAGSTVIINTNIHILCLFIQSHLKA